MANEPTNEAPQLLAFIKIDIEAQAEELQKYLHAKGAEINAAPSADGLLADMEQVIGACHVCFDDAKVESVLGSIVSIITLFPIDGYDRLVRCLCAKLSDSESRRPVCLKSLRMLAASLRPDSSTAYDVYHSLLTVAGVLDQIESVFSSVSEMETALGSNVTLAQKQSLLKLIYRQLLNNHRSESASRVMVQLLSTYSEQTAGEAAEEASACVLAALADPAILLLDYLTALKPVQQLAETPLYRLLDIFVQHDLAAYNAFYEQNGPLITEWGLDHQLNIVKMRKLTFIQLAQTRPEMSFDFLQSTLQLQPDDVEPFLIDVLLTKMVRARMDQPNRVVHVSFATPRTFTTPQWQLLRQTLADWRASIAATRDSLERVAKATSVATAPELSAREGSGRTKLNCAV